MNLVNKLFDLSGKTALITGASSGLGEYFAEILAGAGAQVVITARRLDRLEALAERFNENG
ncbi:MAG: SDR family NAD(P)-dependent oxidoreductase, partial [Pseudomonadales bacterium]